MISGATHHVYLRNDVEAPALQLSGFIATGQRN